jgi:prolyl-tRNA editing enzyme YbaK/EbsC (Cys-tRNA(Pro) deacylase)
MDGHVIIIDLLPELALSDMCVAALEMLADDSILKLGYSLSNDLRRVVPALQAAAGGTACELRGLAVPSSCAPEPEHAVHTLDDAEASDDAASLGVEHGSVEEYSDDMMEDGGTAGSAYRAEMSEDCLGPADVAKELDRLGCLEGDIPAADQMFDHPDAAGSSSADSSQPVKTILLSLKDDALAPVPLIIACVLRLERRLQLGRCASALGCPRSSLSLVPASGLVSVCGFPRGAIGPVGLRNNSVGQAPRVLIDEELMPAELPTYRYTSGTAATASVPSASSSNAQTIVSSDLEAATVLCGGGRPGLVYPVRPRKLLQALGDRCSVAMIHAEGVQQAHESKMSFLPMGRAGRRHRKHRGSADAHTEQVAARHALDLQAAVGQMLPLCARDGKQRKRQDGPMPSPGLAETVSQVLGVKMDKAMQCSSWSDRPLSEAQLHYAANDATVLHLLYERIASGASRDIICQHYF